MLLSSLRAKFRKFDFLLFGSVVLLVVIGLTAIYSVSLSSENPDFTNFKKQLVYFGLGLIFILILSAINFSAFRLYSRYVYLGSIILLILVLFFGSTVRGTTGWFNFIGLRFQPVEIAKIGLLLFLARFFANRFHQFNQAKHIVVSLVGTMILVFLVLLQPDVGSASVLFGIWVLLMIISGVRLRYVATMLVSLALIVLLLWTFAFADYQKNRVLTFLNPELDPLGSGYNVTQAIIAVGSGNLMGRGLGFGSQSQLKFIPESQTDFVFAVVAEELGLLGVSLMLALWVLIFYRLIQSAKKARVDFGMYFLIGICCLFFIHLLVNVGMNMGLLPVTGISLPFTSYGGSFMIACFILIGFAESVIVSE